MFPLSNNGSDPISYSSTDQQSYNNGPFFNDIIPSSKQEEFPLSFFHFPSPFIQCYDLELEEHHQHDVFLQPSHDLLLHQQQPVVNMVDSNKNEGIDQQIKICNTKSHSSTDQQIPRKRSSKRDRHSKIDTAQGPRDRRMRLSLKVAREFFGLQDKLGFDKASKTVEWLLIQAKHEIKKLSCGLPQMNYSCSVGTKSASSTSECEVMSGIDEAAINGGSISKEKPSTCVKKEKKSTRVPSRKAAFNPIARESREKARARARERTRKNLWCRRLIDESSKLCEEATNKEFYQLGCWSDQFETGEESGSQSQNMNNVEAPRSDDQQDQLGTPEDYTLIFNHLHNNGIPQENQLTDFQSFFHNIQSP